MFPFHFLLLRAAINTSSPAYSSALTLDQEWLGGSAGSRQEETCTLYSELNPKVAVGRGSLTSSVPDNLGGSQRRVFEPLTRTESILCVELKHHCAEASLEMEYIILLEYNNPEI